jgi:hypothetical protein
VRLFSRFERPLPLRLPVPEVLDWTIVQEGEEVVDFVVQIQMQVESFQVSESDFLSIFHKLLRPTQGNAEVETREDFEKLAGTESDQPDLESDAVEGHFECLNDALY